MIDPNNTSGIQRFSHLGKPTKYQYMTGITILIPMVGSLTPLLMLIVDTMHSPIYRSNIDYYLHFSFACSSRYFNEDLIRIECLKDFQLLHLQASWTRE